MEVKKVGRCESCGDPATLTKYNDSYSCDWCLSMDKKGYPRREILERIHGRQKSFHSGSHKNRRTGRK